MCMYGYLCMQKSLPRVRRMHATFFFSSPSLPVCQVAFVFPSSLLSVPVWHGALSGQGRPTLYEEAPTGISLSFSSFLPSFRRRRLLFRPLPGDLFLLRVLSSSLFHALLLLVLLSTARPEPRFSFSKQTHVHVYAALSLSSLDIGVTSACYAPRSALVPPRRK